MSYVRVGSVADLTNKAGATSSVPTIDMSDEPEIIPPPAITRPSASDFSTQRRPAPKTGGAVSNAINIGKSYLPGGANFQAALAAKKAKASSQSSGGGMSQTTLMLLLAGAGLGVFLLTRKKGGGSPAPAPAGG